METRAKYITVGTFVLLLITGVFGFVIWLSAFGSEVRYDPYFIRFKGSVSQLRSDSTVLFGGIPVGRVIDVRIDPENTELARVDIVVREGTPIRADSRASLEVQGLAGGVVVQITRGSRKANLLPPSSEIASVPSTLERIANQVPDLLAKIDQIASKVDKVLSPENTQALSATIANLETLSRELAALSISLNELDIDGMVNKAESAVQDIQQTSSAFRDLAGELQSAVGDVKNNARTATKDISAMAEAIAETSNRLSAVVEENREPIKQFSGAALYEITELVTELRRLVASMTRVAHQLENDPARYLLGDRNKGVETE